MSDLLPGLSDDQSLAVSMALEMAPPQLHDGIAKAIAAGLGNDGPPWSNAELMAALVVAMIRCSGLEIPSALFPGANLTADMQQRLAAGAGLSGTSAVKVN
jgi:hypothetical protein